MKLKTLLFKKSLILGDIKRFWWISALYSIILLFFLPFDHYMQKFNLTKNNSEWLMITISRELSFEDSFSQFFLLFAPVIIGTLVFRYMQKSRSASLYHSLPVTRTALYLNSAASSVILLASPLFITACIMLILNGFSFLSAYYSLSLIIKWLLYSLLFGLMFLSMTLFTGMFTGSSVAQMAFVYILNLLPLFLVQFVQMHLEKLLYGFVSYSVTDSLYKKMPLIFLGYGQHEKLNTGLILFYIVLTLALFVGALLAFKLRRPETAGDIITFRPIRPIFVFGATACFTLLGSTYFLIGNKSEFTLIVSGYFICSLIAYIAIQMLTSKSFNILHTYKSYIGFAAVLFFLVLSVKFDIWGYINKIPETAQVQEVYMGTNVRRWQNMQNEVLYNSETGVYRNEKNIENITVLHRLILEKRSTEGRITNIAYRLKSGKEIIRRYALDTELYASALAPIYESSEYKENRFPILIQKAEDLKYVEIHDERSDKNPFILSDKASLEGLKTAMIKDINSIPYNGLVSDYQRIIYMNIIDTDGRNVTYILRPSYSNTIQWLKEKGIYREVAVTADSISSILLENPNYEIRASGSNSAAQETRQVEVTDKAVIQELLDLSFDSEYGKKDRLYISISLIKMNGRPGYNNICSISADTKVSPELKSYLDKIK